jgi:hypothetical protein
MWGERKDLYRGRCTGFLNMLILGAQCGRTTRWLLQILPGGGVGYLVCFVMDDVLTSCIRLVSEAETV